MKMREPAKTVSSYISEAPKEFQPYLKELRALIKKLAPMATERISYAMPFYEYNGPLVYFAAMKDYVGFYVPPPIIAKHSSELKAYKTTKSSVHLPLGRLPKTLITQLIKARISHNKLKTLK